MTVYEKEMHSKYLWVVRLYIRVVETGLVHLEIRVDVKGRTVRVNTGTDDAGGDGRAPGDVASVRGDRESSAVFADATDHAVGSSSGVEGGAVIRQRADEIGILWQAKAKVGQGVGERFCFKSPVVSHIEESRCIFIERGKQEGATAIYISVKVGITWRKV